MKPAFGGLEIASAGDATIPVQIETSINRRINRKTIQVDLRQPTRVTPLGVGGDAASGGLAARFLVRGQA